MCRICVGFRVCVCVSGWLAVFGGGWCVLDAEDTVVGSWGVLGGDRECWGILGGLGEGLRKVLGVLAVLGGLLGGLGWSWWSWWGGLGGGGG